MNPVKSIALLGGLVAALLSPSSASAASVAIANCSQQSITLCAYNSSDLIYFAPASRHTLNPGEAGNATCSTGTCQVLVAGAGSTCDYTGITGLTQLLAHGVLGVVDAGNRSYQFRITNNFTEIGSSNNAFENGAFCTAQNGDWCGSDGDCHSGNCLNNECVVASATTVTPMCSEAPNPLQLNRRAALSSCDGRYSLLMQGDGNLVLSNSAGIMLWNSGTWMTNTFFGVYPGDHMLFADDGDLQIIDVKGNVVDLSHTAGYPNDQLIMQDDGNLVIYTRLGVALWATGTNGQ